MRFSAGVFDLGGVLIDWNPRHLYRKLFPGDEAGMERFLAEVCTPAWNLELDRGRTFQEAIDELKLEHPGHAALIQAYWDRWPEMLGEVDQATAQIVRELREGGLRVYALSNWSAQTYTTTRHLVPELALFNDVLVSGEARRIKPDPELFAVACRRFGIEPGETFFVDDAPANVEAGRRVGFTTLQFTGAAALRQELELLGVLPAQTTKHPEVDVS